MHDPHYLARARELATRHDVLLIADEIMTGFGRTGTLFACEQAGISPDLLCLSKGITGGYLPLSCVLATDAVYAAFYDDDVARAFLHSHSYTGNALACRAALAVLDIFRDEDVIAANRARAARWTALAAPLAAHRKVTELPHARHDLGVRGRFGAAGFRALVLRRGTCARAAAAPDRPNRLFHAAVRRHRRRVRAAHRAHARNRRPRMRPPVSVRDASERVPREPGLPGRECRSARHERRPASRPRRRCAGAALALLAALAVLAAPPAGAKLPRPLGRAFLEAGVPLNAVSIVVQQIGHPPLFAYDPERSMNPASVMKLVTTFAALELLGPDYRWKTEAYLGGPLEDGTLRGDLILKGYGDPKITVEQWQAFMADLRERGLATVTGDLVLDRTQFRLPPHDPEAFDGEPLKPYNVGPDALLLSFKSVRFVFTPNAAATAWTCASSRRCRRSRSTRPRGSAAATARTGTARCAPRSPTAPRPPGWRSRDATRQAAPSATGSWHCWTRRTSHSGCSRRTFARPADASTAT